MPKIVTQEEIIKRFIKIHGYKYNYSKVIYINNYTPVIIICSIHGEFEQIPYVHLRGSGCQKCNNENVGNFFRSNLEDWIQKVIKVHGNKYDYSKFIYVNNATKGIIICPEHGEFDQVPNNHLQGKGCPKCNFSILHNLIKTTQEEFIRRVRLIHGNKYDYSLVLYVDTYTKVIIICPKHGKFLQSPRHHLSGCGCPRCKKSKGEIAIENVLNKNNINNDYQYRIPDEKYDLWYDFYLPELNILIEFHGIQHYEWIPHFHRTYEKFRKAQERDIFKKELAKLKRIPLIEFNYRQFEFMSKEQFEQLVISKISLI